MTESGPSEETTYRDSVDQRMKTFERDMRESNTRLETGQDEVIKQVRYTNGKVRWLEKMIYLAIGGLGVLSLIVLPLIWALITVGKI